MQVNCCISLDNSMAWSSYGDKTVQRLFMAMDWTWGNKGTVPDFPWRWAVVVFTVESLEVGICKSTASFCMVQRERNGERKWDDSPLWVREDWGKRREEEKKRKEEGCFWLWLRRGWDDGEKQGGVGQSAYTVLVLWNMGYYRRIIERTGELDRIKKE